MKIVTVSLDQVWEDKKANMNQITNLMAIACQNHPDIVVFPEMTLTGFTMNSRDYAENPENSDTISFFSKLAIDYSVNIICGVILNTKEKPTNNLVVLSSKGELLSRYEKIHPFSYSGEDNAYSKGDSIAQFEIDDVRCAATICYDLRFPELYQILSVKSIIIFNIANWPEKRVKDWNLLLHARALENQCFIVGVNRTGTDGKGLQYAKSSAVIDPRGIDIVCTQINNVIDEYSINVTDLEEYREEFPVKKDRRIELYKTLM